MKYLKKIQILNSLDLKILAMIFMLCDHLWGTLIPGNQWLNNIGRLAFPIFAFQIAEGAVHTSNFKKYLGRMFVFALISEIPFNLMMSGSAFFPFHQNVMFTFTIALLMISILRFAKKKNIYLYIASAVICCFLGYMLGTISMSDYYGYGVLTVLVFYIFRDFRFSWVLQFVTIIYINAFMMSGLTYNFELFGININFPQQAFAILSLILIAMYNGKQGIKNNFTKYGTYLFYPIHMLILYFINSVLQ